MSIAKSASTMVSIVAEYQPVSNASSLSSIFSCTLAFLSLVFIYWFGYGRFQHFKKDRLKGPIPTPFLGNILDFAQCKWQLHLMVDNYYKKYGGVFGMYINSSPTVVVSDPDMVKQVLVKDFAKFHDRQIPVELPSPHNNLLNFVKGERWKFIRSTMTPSFSLSKIRQMSGLMNRVADGVIDVIKAKAEKNAAVDFVRLQQGVTMEAILSAAFGVDAKLQSANNEKINEKARKVLESPWWLNVLLMIPLSYKFVKYIPWVFTFTLEPITKIAQTIIAERKNGDPERQDVLQCMLKAQQTADDKGRALTDDEITAQSVVLMAAGYGTASTTLALICYNLALYPDAQGQLYNEIRKYWPDDDRPDYDIIQKMLYLDQVICETLRLYPPGYILFRSCNKDCAINGVHFRNGYDIVIPVYSIHRDPQIWEKPEKFDPDRFSHEARKNRNPYVYLPFGHGPRSCIGMRFAQMEIKIILARILKEFRLEISEETRVPIKPVAKVTLSVKDPLMLRVVKRA